MNAVGHTFGSTTISVSFGGQSAQTTLAVTDATLASIAITPVTPSIAYGTNQQFTATGTYGDASTGNVSNTAVWTSSDPSIATITSSGGLATPTGVGSTTITATLGSITNSTVLTVAAQALPPNVSNPIATADSAIQITLSWVSGGGTSTGYTIAYQAGATAPADCSAGTITTSSTISKSIVGLISATQYSFRICAVNSNATPDISSGVTVSATTLEANPPNPTGLATTLDSTTQITLNWTSGGGSTATYKIAYQTGATAPLDCATGTTTTSASTSKVIGSLSPGTQYSFRVCAINSNPTPNSSTGISVTDTTPQAAPPNPTGLNLTVNSTTQISASWTSGGGSTASYILAYQSGATAPADCSSGTTATSSSTSKSIGSLAAGTQYSFRVCALNSNGTPDVSAGVTASASTLQSAPPNPSGLSATVDSTTQITLNWTSGGGSTASYKIAYQAGATAPSDCTAGTITTSATITKAISSLSPGTQYSFRVCALNANATPDLSTGITTSATSLQAAPPNPTSPTAAVDSTTQITVSWTSGGGSTASYNIAYQTGSTAPASCSAGTTTTSVTSSKSIGSLSPGTQYSFRICAVNSNASPDESSGVTTSATIPLDAPPNPTGLSGSADSSTQITISWTSGGGTTATYRIAYQTGATAPADCSSGTTTTSATTTKSIGSLTPATQYSFRVCSVNGNGTPDVSSGITTSVTIPQLPPPNPSGPSATVDSLTQITVAWTSGGGSTSSYKIAYQTGATAPADCASGTTTTSATTSKSISSLASGTQYSFRICALNSNDTPDVSTGITATATIPQAAPPNPTSPGATIDSSTQITLAWTTGGGTTASYKIAYQTGATAPADCANGTVVTSATTSKAITGLSAATQYAFRICALNSNTTPDVSSGVTTSATTLQAAPANPTSPTATVNSSTQITVAWTSGGGTTATYKIAYQSGATAPSDCSSGTTTTSATASKAIGSLAAATQYSFRICALNSNPTPDESAGVTTSATTLQAEPPNPTGPGTTIDSTSQITLAWTSGGGSTATYKIAYQAGATAPTDCASGTTTTSATNSKAIGSLLAGTQYSFRICALNSNSTPDISSGVTTSGTTLQAAPPNPTGPGTTVNSTTQITVAWTSGGGSTASYKIAYQTGATAPADCASGTTTTSATTSKAISTLSAGTQYSFRICALNGNGTPDISSGVTTTATTLQDPPPNPTSPTTTVDSSVQITVSWTSGGGSTASYKIAYQSGATAPADCASGTTTTSATTSKAVASLSPATQYSFRVCALNSNGTPDVSSGVTTTATTLQAAPPNPTSPVATIDSTTQMTLSWTSGGGSTATYKIAYQSGVTAPADCASGTTTTSATNSKVIGSLSTGTQYAFRICALNSNATPDVSSGVTVSGTTLQVAPPNPTGLGATVNSHAQITLAWTSGGGTTASYQISYQTGASAPTDCASGTTTTSAVTSKAISSLTPATQYSFRVCALNSNGTPDTSSGVTVTATTNLLLISSWSFVDGGGSTGINKNTTVLANNPVFVSFNSKLYATWQEVNGSAVEQIRVAVFNGNDSSPSWAFVDGNGVNGLNKDVTKKAKTPQMVAFNSKLYLTWSEIGGTQAQIRMAVYNGNDASPSWSFIDGNGTNGVNKSTAQPATDPYLTVFNSKLYATWSEYGTGAPTNYEIRVSVYNGNDSSPSWSFVDGNSASAGLNKSSARYALNPKMIAFDSKLYITWTEDAGGDAPVAHVGVYNGNDSSPSWSFVDGGTSQGVSKGSLWSSNPTFVTFNSKLYLSWSDDSNSSPNRSQIRIAVYNSNDSSPSWTFLDGNGTTGLNYNTTRSGGSISVAAFGSTIYASWYEQSTSGYYQIRVRAYNANDASPAWTFVDGNGVDGLNKVATYHGQGPQFVPFNSKLYLGWYEANVANSIGQIRVTVGN